jgi:hypothetical protein
MSQSYKNNIGKIRLFEQFNGIDNFQISDIYNSYRFKPSFITDSEDNIEKTKQIINKNDKIKQLYGNDIYKLCINRQCKHCNITYQEKDNFKWKCKFHPGKIDPYNDFKYTCCGASTKPGEINYERSSIKGCKRCDHSINIYNYNEDDNQCIPVCLIELGIINLDNNINNIINIVVNQENDLTTFYILKRFQQ